MAVNGKQHLHEQVTLLPQDNYLIGLMTTLRDAQTNSTTFVNAFEKVAGQLMIAALKHVPTEPLEVVTPTGSKYIGVRQVTPVCGVSILRAGASMENALRNAYTGPLSYGKILIQRDEETCLPVHLYSKFPATIASKIVFVLEPMLATGGSASQAIDILKEEGVSESNIVFVNLVASREGITKITTRFPTMKLVTAAIDEDMTPSNHIAPGLGDFGDRFYGTTE